MDIISQLQEQVNLIAALTFNAFGTLQRDAPPTQLSPNYAEPPATTTATDDATTPFPEQPKQLGAGLVKAAKQFDALVAALPLSEGSEEAQFKRIAELQVENDLIGQERQKQLEATVTRTIEFDCCNHFQCFSFGTLQRDAPHVQLSPNYLEPPATTTATDDATTPFPEQPKQLGAGLVKAAKQFDALVSALPLLEGGEEAQLEKVAELQVENDLICQERQKQLEATEKVLKQVQELFGQAADDYLNMKKPE